MSCNKNEVKHADGAKPSSRQSTAKPTVTDLYEIDAHTSMVLALKVEHLKAAEAQQRALNAMNKNQSVDVDEIYDEFPELHSPNIEARFDWTEVTKRSKLGYTNETLHAHRELNAINVAALAKRQQEEAIKQEKYRKKQKKSLRDKPVRAMKNQEGSTLGVFLSNLPHNEVLNRGGVRNLEVSQDIGEDSLLVATPASTWRQQVSNGDLGGSISDEVGTVQGASHGRQSRQQAYMMSGASYSSALFSPGTRSHISSIATTGQLSKGVSQIGGEGCDNDTDSSEDEARRLKRHQKTKARRSQKREASSSESSSSEEVEEEDQEDESSDETEDIADENTEDEETEEEEEEEEDGDSEAEDEDSTDDTDGVVDETEGDGVDWDASDSGYSSSTNSTPRKRHNARNKPPTKPLARARKK